MLKHWILGKITATELLKGEMLALRNLDAIPLLLYLIYLTKWRQAIFLAFLPMSWSSEQMNYKQAWLLSSCHKDNLDSVAPVQESREQAESLTAGVPDVKGLEWEQPCS